MDGRKVWSLDSIRRAHAMSGVDVDGTLLLRLGILALLICRWVHDVANACEAILLHLLLVLLELPHANLGAEPKGRGPKPEREQRTHVPGHMSTKSRRRCRHGGLFQPAALTQYWYSFSAVLRSKRGPRSVSDCPLIGACAMLPLLPGRAVRPRPCTGKVFSMIRPSQRTSKTKPG